MTNTPSKQTTTRRPDCVTEVRMGVSANDKM